MRGLLKRGANVALTQEVPSLKGVVLALRWDAGREHELRDSVVVATLLCGADGRVLSDEHFVFVNQLMSSDLSVKQLDAVLGDDNEQIEVDLSSVPAAVHRIVVMTYVNEGSAKNRSLGQLRSCVVRVLNRDGNTELVTSEDLAQALSMEKALVLGELYRHGSGWKFKVIGQGYAEGLRAVARDYGVPL